MSYSFLKESKLYIEYGGNKYRIYTTTAISFSQSFTEDSYPVKTLHDQTKMIDGTTITKANPAQFSFTVPLTEEKDESIVMDLVSDLVASGSTQQLKSFNLYIKTGSSTFKIEGGIALSASIDVGNKGKPFEIEVSGQGTKLTRVGDESYNLGTIQSESPSRTPILVYPVLAVDSLDMSSILSATVQIQNTVKWTENSTLQESLAVTSSSNAIFPSAYTVTKRIVSGTIQQYQTDDNITQFDDFNTTSNITIKALQVGKAASATPFFQLQLNPAMYTARVQQGPVYLQAYDYRSVDNTALGTRITHYS